MFKLISTWDDGLCTQPDIYALRNMVERCFTMLKNSRRLATRYDKTQIISSVS